MKFKVLITSFCFFLSVFSWAQETAVPKAKSKAERKAERKSMSLEEKIEDVLPVDVGLPSASVNAPGQKISTVEEAKKYVSETVPSYAEKAKEFRKKQKEAKKKKKENTFNGKEYEGFDVEKRIYRRGSGSRMQYIEFYTLKEYQQGSPYVRSLFWFDDRTKRVIEAVARDHKTNHLLHGPYREYRGEHLVKTGVYYLGAKDGRWETYDSDDDFTLLDKEYFDRGFLADSEITYYNGNESKIDEVIPYRFGEKTGPYLKYFEGGGLEVEGEYDDGVKVGRWVEYYTGNRRKKEIQYGKDKFDEMEPKLLREYSEDGKMIYEDESLKRM
ncbi:hypothetical protein LAG90_11220 [Marinilongibacter aquaticus]|uniref:toxin-antitoxin system YwqK family antitoxin n=1 Tax=Marinilongibacter aquaticus TaxID=2975157 RepID=UPI0021BD05B7|nr:hypothetical protein [Marinilongibacter aquaticus]UBM57389.1 hypothetical protein LAG90_11220 [Marinilongibacter aquaticus]